MTQKFYYYMSFLGRFFSKDTPSSIEEEGVILPQKEVIFTALQVDGRYGFYQGMPIRYEAVEIKKIISSGTDTEQKKEISQILKEYYIVSVYYQEKVQNIVGNNIEQVRINLSQIFLLDFIDADFSPSTVRPPQTEEEFLLKTEEVEIELAIEKFKINDLLPYEIKISLEQMMERYREEYKAFRLYKLQKENSDEFTLKREGKNIDERYAQKLEELKQRLIPETQQKEGNQEILSINTDRENL